ncbi:MAG: hypothetical protein JWM56_1019 [Candidatus Peribacteria bacterium]|nr:hypothetical protein [Candidatus Peribacteria bacterium]
MKQKLNIFVLAGMIMHSVMAGRFWLWNVFSFLPSALFVLPLIVLIVWNIRWKNTCGMLFVLAAVPFTFFYADIQLPSLFNPSHSDSSITVFNLNTEYWETGHEKEFLEFLKNQQADVYQLQEFWTPDGTPLTDTYAIKAVFPGYDVINDGELLTISRFPVLHSSLSDTKKILRTDIDVHGNTVSFYNVHITPPIDTTFSSAFTFLSMIKEKFTRRLPQFSALQQDATANIHPVYISGDFNTTKSMGDMIPLLRNFEDSSHKSSSIIPHTWGFTKQKILRIDYNLVKGMKVLRHQSINASNFSDHNGQRVTVSL